MTGEKKSAKKDSMSTNKKTSKIKKLQDENRKIKKQLKEKNAEVEKYLDQLKWVTAEYENYKKKVERDKQNISKSTKEDIIKKLLIILDQLELSIENIKKTENLELIKGLEMVHENLMKILKNEGVQEIKSIGEKFDPFKHEAMMHIPDEKYKSDTIIEEFQKG
jgi:molecular chaperone GrpE